MLLQDMRHKYAHVVQLVEYRTFNAVVGSSSLFMRTIFIKIGRRTICPTSHLYKECEIAKAKKDKPIF